MEHKWLLAHGETLREKHPKFRRMLNHLRQMNTKAFAIAVLEELIMLVVITVYVFWGGSYAVELWTAVFMAFSIHLIIHIGQSIVVRGYVPGFVTSILLLPFSYLGMKSIWNTFSMAKLFTRKFQESMMKRSERENCIDSPYNWQAHYQLGKVNEEFTLSYTRCELCELARKRGHLNILPAMCRTDYITFEAMGAILHRNKTLASGDECCLYYMTKPGSEAEHRWQDEHPDGTFRSK